MQAILKVLILFIVVLLAVSYSEDLDAKTNYASFSAEDVIITPSVSASAAHSWQDTASHDSCKLSNRRNEGSAKRMSGNIYILSIFISDKPWDKISKQKLFEKLYIAEDKIKKEAKKYNVDVEFKNGQYGFDKSIGMSVAAGRGRRDEDPNVANKALEILGYTNDRQFYEWVKNNEGCNNCLIIAFVNKAGRSYAVPYETGLSSRYFTESCVLYDRCENGEKTTAASIAHEMLHCFGAEDLYETFEIPKSVETLAKTYYSDDLMHRVDYDISKQEIGDFTAWCIGLSDKRKGFYDLLLKRK